MARGGRRDGELPPIRGRREADVRDEIEFHLEQRALEFERQGMDPEAARQAARDAFGDPESIAKEVRGEQLRQRDSGTFGTLGAFMWDLRMVARGLRRRPTFTAVVVLTLGLGIGAVTAVFSVVDASLLRTLPFADARELVFLQGAFDAPEGPQVRGGSIPEVRDWATLSRSFEGVAAFDGSTFTLTGSEGDAESVNGESVDRGYFELLEVHPLMGRTFASDEYEQGTAVSPVLIGEALWTRRFGRDPSIVGRRLTLNGSSFTVVGVLPSDFRGMSLEADLWVPLAAVDVFEMTDRGSRWLAAVARLRPSVTLAGAQADMDRVAASLEERYPESHRDRIALVKPIRDVYMGSAGSLMLVILGTTGVLLLIAMLNVANLLLVRAWAATPELLMRRALGAGRFRLVAQFLGESLILSGLGAVVGLVIGAWGAAVLARAMTSTLLPPYAQVGVDAPVFAVVVGLTTLVGLATGLVPALFASKNDLASGLRERSAGGSASSRFPLQRVIVVGEVALAVLLLVGAGLMARSLGAQLTVEPGFDSDRLLAFLVDLPPERYPDPETRLAAGAELLGDLSGGPAVSAATLSSDAPLRGRSSATYLYTAEEDADRIRFYRHMVGPDFFEVMGIDIRDGSGFEGFNAAATGDVAVVSRAMAERTFGQASPIGRTFRIGAADGLELTIVGVADDVRWRDLTTDLVSGPTDPDIYLPWVRFPSPTMEVLVRTEQDPALLVPWVRETVKRFDPNIPPVRLEPMTEALRSQTTQGRFGSLLLGAFSALATLLAAVGLYGVLSFAVGRRTREIAVRMAMGADAARVRNMVVFNGLRLAAAGLAVGTLVAWQASHALDAFLFGVRSLDPLTYVAGGALMAGVTAFAAWLPALRATRVDPHTALSAE